MTTLLAFQICPSSPWAEHWDVGHAEGSGEISNRELEKLATLQSEELLEQIKGRDL